MIEGGGYGGRSVVGSGNTGGLEMMPIGQDASSGAVSDGGGTVGSTGITLIDEAANINGNGIREKVNGPLKYLYLPVHDL